MEFSLLTFAFLVFVVVVTPGPTVLLALSNGARFGLRRAFVGMAGAALSDLVLITAAALGLGAVLTASVFLFEVVKWLGVAYLAFLGIQLLRSNGNFGNSQEGTLPGKDHGTGSHHSLFQKSFLVAVTNPKGYLFFAAFLPQFIDASTPTALQYSTLAAVFVAIDLAVMAAYAILGANVMRFLRRQGALWIDRTCGVALLALAATLGLYRRAEG